MYLIIGIDPGTTTGIAALDLKGNLIKLISIRNGGKAEVIRRILAIGTPSVIATDKKPCPDFVLKIASSFNVHLYVPEKELRHDEKVRIAKERGTKAKNDHERDAYAAAYKAYYEYDNRLRQIDNLKEYSKDEKDYLKNLVLNGHSLSNAVLFLKKPVEEIKEEAEKKPTFKEKTIEEYIERIRELSKKTEELQKALEKEKIERKDLEWEIKKQKSIRAKEIARDKEVVKLNKEIQRLKMQIGLKKSKKPKRKKYAKKEEKKSGRKDLKRLVKNIITEYRDKRKKEL